MSDSKVSIDTIEEVISTELKPDVTENSENGGVNVNFEDGEILFNKGDKASYLAIVLNGLVEIFDPVDNTKIAILRPGSAFGEHSIIDGGIRSASARSVGNVKCLQIETEPIRDLLKKDSGLLLSAIEGLLLQLSMCNHISKLILNNEGDLFFELIGNEKHNSTHLKKILNDAISGSDSSDISSDKMMYLKLMSSRKLHSLWFESGKKIGSPADQHLGNAYVIVDGTVNAECGTRNIHLGHGSVLGLAEAITTSPFSWTLVAHNNLTVKVIPISKVIAGIQRTHPGIKGIVRYTSSRIIELQKAFIL
jgi:hypothetical protein